MKVKKLIKVLEPGIKIAIYIDKTIVDKIERLYLIHDPIYKTIKNKKS